MKSLKVLETKRFQKKVSQPNERTILKEDFKPIIIGGGQVEVEKQ